MSEPGFKLQYRFVCGCGYRSKWLTSLTTAVESREDHRIDKRCIWADDNKIEKREIKISRSGFVDAADFDQRPRVATSYPGWRNAAANSSRSRK